jgi:hypothetical protein
MSQLDAFGFVDSEHCNRRASRLRSAKQHRTDPSEVSTPTLAARIEKQNRVASQRIST